MARSDSSAPIDLAIVGAGPAGLAAAVYSTREDIKTTLFEKGVVGGLAAITDIIDNYPGFDKGVGGLELADHLFAHAKRYGAEVRSGVAVTGLSRQSDLLHLKLSGSQELVAHSVLIATGSTYRHLGVPGEDALVGRGVHFCATCDGPIYRDKELVVVGGGNSAMQETLFLTKFASHITLLVRGPELKGSAILRHQVQQLPNVTFVYETAITQLERNDQNRLTVRAEQGPTKTMVTYQADGLFVFIGLLPNTQAFKGVIDLDERGFVITGTNFATSLPGVYAAGDVRSGSTWQIASAIGEGVSAALAIRAYLDALKRSSQ